MQFSVFRLGVAPPGRGSDWGPRTRAGGLISGEVNWEGARRGVVCGARFWFYGLVPGREGAGSLPSEDSSGLAGAKDAALCCRERRAVSRVSQRR